MNSEITRWSRVPSYSGSVLRTPSRGSVHSLAPVASSTKFATVFGACSGIRRAVNEPMDVTKVAGVMRSPSLGGGGSLPPAASGQEGRRVVAVLVPVRGPRGPRRHRELRQTDQRGVVVHPLPPPLPPPLIAVR